MTIFFIIRLSPRVDIILFGNTAWFPLSKIAENSKLFRRLIDDTQKGQMSQEICRAKHASDDILIIDTNSNYTRLKSTRQNKARHIIGKI